MGVLLGRSPVGRPTGVPHPGLYLREVPVAPRNGAGKVLQPPDLPDLLYATFPLKGEPRRVVPAVLEVSETLHEHFHTTFPTGVTHDAAHGPTSLSIHRWNAEGQRGDRAIGALVRARTVLCPRRHRRDLSPPLRPPEAETHPPNASMNVFLVDSRISGSPGALVSLPRKPRRSHRACWPSTANVL